MEFNKKLLSVVDGKEIYQCEMSNNSRINVNIINYGAIVKNLSIPDKNGKIDDVVLGFDDVSKYMKKHPYFGAVAGRYANRIANGRFSINNQHYSLALNNGENHLHGGLEGFDKKVWSIIENCDDKGVSVTMRYLSEDGEENYPGNLDVTVTYTLNDDNEFIISYSARTDKSTILNLTNHSYFNLAGEGTGDVLKHEVMINAKSITEVNPKLIPTGNYIPVKNTPFDFTSLRSISSRIHETGAGYDHNYILNKQPCEIAHVASAYEPLSGRTMDVYTTQPGMQFYTGNFLDGSLVGKRGVAYHKHFGFCFETQHFPDSPNHPDFPSTLLLPGEVFSEVTIYKFGVRY